MSVKVNFRKNGVALVSFRDTEKIIEVLHPDCGEEWGRCNSSHIDRALDGVEDEINEAREELQNIQTALGCKVQMSKGDVLDLVEKQSYWREELENLIAVRAQLVLLYRIFNTSTWEDDKEIKPVIEWRYS